MPYELDHAASVRACRQLFYWALSGLALVAAVRGDDALPLQPDAAADWQVQIRPQPSRSSARLLALDDQPSAPLLDAASPGLLSDFTLPSAVPGQEPELTDSVPDSSEVAPFAAALPTHGEPRGGSITHFETADGGWTVVVTPAAGHIAAPQPYAMTYEQAYHSIPYRRAEYLANPGYRHEAALELMFGQMRPTTVVNQRLPQTVPVPTRSFEHPYRYSRSDLYRLSPWSNGAFLYGAAPWGGVPLPSFGPAFASPGGALQPLLGPATPLLY